MHLLMAALASVLKNKKKGITCLTYRLTRRLLILWGHPVQLAPAMFPVYPMPNNRKEYHPSNNVFEDKFFNAAHFQTLKKFLVTHWHLCVYRSFFDCWFHSLSSRFLFGLLLLMLVSFFLFVISFSFSFFPPLAAVGRDGRRRNT